MNSIKRKLAFTLTVIALIGALTMPGLATPALAYSSYPLQPTDIEIVNALNYLRTAQQDDGNIGGFGISAWVVMAIAAAGEDPHDWNAGGSSIVDYLRDNSSLLDPEKATDWERSILAITASGEDPSNFGGVDYMASLTSLYDGNQIGYDDTLNDDFWGILALIAAGESSSSEIIQNTVSFIKLNQNEDGGWSWAVGDDSDVDDTGAAIMALIAAGESPDSYVIMEGLAFLMDSQNDDGGFPWMWPGESNSSSDSWAIGGIVAAGGNPSGPDWMSWMDNTPIDQLLSLQDTDGAFKWTADEKSNPEFMTAYAIPALLGKPYPVVVQEASPPTEPTIAFSPSSLSSTATEDGANPASKTLKVWNSGTGTLDWSVSDDANWLSLNPTSGNSTGEKDEVTVSVDISSMDAGDYEATITISAEGAPNTPQTVSVSLHIGVPPTGLTIAFSPPSLSFTATEGGADPSNKTLKIWNSGTDTLDWSVSDNANWLSLSPTSGSSTGEKDKVTVSVDISGMSAGNYDAKITLRDSEAANSPQRVSVSLHIGTGSIYYSLTTNVSPTGGGNVSLDPAQPTEGYIEDSEVELTANPATGYAFGCWTGNLSGSANPITIAMDSDKNLTANFVLFNTADLPNVEVMGADPEVVSVSVDSYPVKNLTNVPSDLDPQLAYVVDSEGSGSFTLSFADVPNNDSLKVYKVTGSGWAEIEGITVTNSVMELTMNIGDPTIVFALPTSTDNRSFIGKINSAIGNLDMASKISIGVIIALVVAIVVAFRKVIRKGA